MRMAFVWLVECKVCTLRFPVQRREIVEGKATDSLPKGKNIGSFECPHCHEEATYSSDDCIPGEGRLPQ
jgi:hypothetical protein